MAKKLSKKQRKQQEKRQRVKDLRGLLKLRKKKLKKYETRVREIESELSQLHKMKPGGGRPKGNSNENRVAKLIVAQFQCFGVKDTDCYRTPGSGGHRYAKKEDPGDLVLSKKLRKIFPFSVECKHYKRIDLFRFWRPTKEWGSWPVKEWLKQTCKAAAGRKGLYPLLIMRQNGSQDLAVLPELMPLVSQIKPRHKFRFQGSTWYVVALTDLLEGVKRLNENL